MLRATNPPLQEKRGKSRAEFIEPLNRHAAARRAGPCSLADSGIGDRFAAKLKVIDTEKVNVLSTRHRKTDQWWRSVELAHLSSYRIVANVET